MHMKHHRIYWVFLSLLLTMVLVTGCLPRPDRNTPTTAAPYPEETPAEYEQFEEKKLAEQTRFQQMEDELFRSEMSSALLNLHFMLKDPAACGIGETEYLYPPVSLESIQQSRQEQEALAQELSTFDTALLDEEQKVTLRVLESFLKTEKLSHGLELYAQPLAPTIGLQAQLPILLCEYAFYQKQDVDDYLKLLEHIDEYYGEILQFEQQKAEAGLMMSDTTIDHIIESCESYLLIPDNNFMIDSFNSRLDTLRELTEEEKTQYRTQNAAALEQHFVPAYQLLIDGMQKLKGTGANQKGMCGYPKGKEYYRYQVFSSTGTSYSSVEELLTDIGKVIDENLMEISLQLKAHPELQSNIDSYAFRYTEPTEIMEALKILTNQDFPELPECSYTLKDVPTALELSLSPAFYVTSPIDDSQNNVIYINRNPLFSQEGLFPTIAHEGYPGHLYQNVYFNTNCSSRLRKILSFTGYSEGWASYVERLTYSLDNGLEPGMGALLGANSMANLGIHAYLDISVNYMGWDKAQVQEYLSKYYTDPAGVADVMFETMVENPSNYLSYFVGCMEFQNMRKTAEKQLGDRFNAKEFHRFLLDMGNAPFDVIQAYFTSWLMEQKL